MNQTSTKSGLFRKLSIGLGLALAVSTVGVSASSAKSVPSAKKAINLVVMLGEKDSGWCTQDSPGGGQIGASNAVLETLTVMNKKGEMVPYLAKAFSHSADYKTWTVALREGITYTDGEVFNADNVISNVQALLGVLAFYKGAGPTASLPAIAWQGAFEAPGMANLKKIGAAMAAGTSPAKIPEVGILMKAVAKGIVKLDAYTVQFNLANPRPNFMYNLWTAGRVRMMSTKSLISKACGTTEAVGTGPFMIKAKGIDQFTTELVKNPNYWRKDKAGKQLPYADTLTFKAVLDGGQRVNALAKGQADISIFGATSGQQINRMKTMKNVKLYEGARVTNWTIHFNTTAAPFNSQTAREAVSYALDRVSYAKVLCGGNCSAATSIAPKGHPLYFPGMITFNLAKAKEKVAAYKTETGKDLDISVPISDTAESTAEATMFCTMMKAAGAGCSLMAPVTSTAYILRGFGLKQQSTEFNTLSGTYAEFGLLFLTDTDLELSGFRFTNPALAACFKNAQMVALKGDAAPYKPCMEELQGKSIWTGVYTEGLFFATGTGVTGITDTVLPDGGTRDAVQPGFGDWAMISKA